VASGRGDVYESLYPATGEPIARVRAASEDDVLEAIEKADHAFRHSGWAQKLPHERATVLHKIAALIRAEAEELAQKQRLDNGKPISETRALVASAAATFQYFAAACETLEETITPSRGPFVTMSVYEPMGVVAAITPWNSPIASEAQKLAPALAAGNAVIVKPAEVTPLMALELARICEQAGVPKGMVSVLPGKGSVIGDVITRHPLIKRVSFYRRHEHGQAYCPYRRRQDDAGFHGAGRQITHHRAGRCGSGTRCRGCAVWHFQQLGRVLHCGLPLVCVGPDL